MARVVLLLAVALTSARPLAAQTRAPDAVATLAARVERALNAKDPSALTALFADSVPQVQLDQYGRDLLTPDAVRTVVRERERSALEGAPPGDGFRLVVEFFIERARTARILSAVIDVRRPPGGDDDTWRIVNAEGMTSVEGLHKLQLNTTAPLGARNLEITVEDLALTLEEGTVFPVESEAGVTGLVLVGRGEMRFSPAPASERGQLRIFAGDETLTTPFETAFLRMNPSDYREMVGAATQPVVPQTRAVRRAREVFERQAPMSFTVDLQDLSRDTWHLLPQGDDVLVEVDTRRFDTLTYSRASNQAEDISLFRREDRRTIALYSSVAKLAARGRFYSEDALRDYDVIDYDIEASIDPERELVRGRARLVIRVRSVSLGTILLRLANPLVVTGLTSVEYGRLLHLRLTSQNAILINLPRVMSQDSDLTLVVNYAGRLSTQELDIDALQVGDSQVFGSSIGEVEPNYLLSNRSYWYPQNPVSDYATATMRITVPEQYAAVASGQPMPAESLVSLRDIVEVPDAKVFAFRAAQPLRYLAVLVSRLSRAAESTIELPDGSNPGTTQRVTLAVDVNPRQQLRARDTLRSTEDIMRFYAELIGDAPYQSATVALVEDTLPGGHSPAYLAVIKNPLPNAPNTWRNDPAAFDFPEFFLAHELAHQWWGQGVSWKNYHEQWISEGFAQYFAALYAQKARGDRTFVDMLRQFRRWGLAESDQGPVHLGYRLGHIKGDLRVFRAVVYNKGASVLHMLRRLLGDEVFFNSLRRFYNERRYQKAGTDDLERAFEAESGRVLDRFFERWIYSTELPRVTFDYTIGEKAVTVRFQQSNELVFDLPVTVTITLKDGRTIDVVVPVTEPRVERSIPVSGPVREVQINRDFAALAEFDERR